jgi:maltose 6'-phosphate phosphatase
MKMSKVILFSKMSVLVMLLLVLASSTTLATDCPVISQDGGHLRVMTINLLFSEVQDRNDRLERIADYAVGKRDDCRAVDVILLQEVVAGALAGTVNAAQDLKRMLAERGVDYYLSYRLANGIPGLLAVGNAVLSRHKILYTLARSLPFVSEEVFDGFVVTLRRRAMMSRIEIPGSGTINVYNTHLCAFCSSSDRYRQAEVLYDFIRTVEFFTPGRNPIILGGDFNTEPQSDLYDAITGLAGFIDSFEVANGGACTEGDTSGCTYAVPGNDYVGSLASPIRIDYLFYKDWLFDPSSSAIVFDSEGNWVSDHSAVVTDFNLPHP